MLCIISDYAIRRSEIQTPSFAPPELNPEPYHDYYRC